MKAVGSKRGVGGLRDAMVESTAVADKVVSSF